MSNYAKNIVDEWISDTIVHYRSESFVAKAIILKISSRWKSFDEKKRPIVWSTKSAFIVNKRIATFVLLKNVLTDSRYRDIFASLWRHAKSLICIPGTFILSNLTFYSVIYTCNFNSNCYNCRKDWDQVVTTSNPFSVLLVIFKEIKRHASVRNVSISL